MVFSPVMRLRLHVCILYDIIISLQGNPLWLQDEYVGTEVCCSLSFRESHLIGENDQWGVNMKANHYSLTTQSHTKYKHGFLLVWRNHCMWLNYPSEWIEQTIEHNAKTSNLTVVFKFTTDDNFLLQNMILTCDMVGHLELMMRRVKWCFATRNSKFIVRGIIENEGRHAVNIWFSLQEERYRIWTSRRLQH